MRGLTLSLAALSLAGCASSDSAGSKVSQASLRSALTLHASFDHGLNADFAKGDPTLRRSTSMAKRTEWVAGLPVSGEVVLAKGEGITGDALRFVRKESPVLHFAAQDNVAWNPTNWSGTVSFWLRLDPEEDLEPGYTDPIQLTPRAWDDAAFFTEFAKDGDPRHFRLGAYADFKVWNPSKRNWDTMPWEEKPLVSVKAPPFGRDRWTHVAFSWENFNTRKTNGVAYLYLNGQPQGEISPREQTFTWDTSKAAVMLGLSYIGLWDELSIFSRRLTDAEVQALSRSPSLLRAK